MRQLFLLMLLLLGGTIHAEAQTNGSINQFHYNRILAAHHFYPLLSGKGIGISIKDLNIDSRLPDLWGNNDSLLLLNKTGIDRTNNKERIIIA